ncbi:hypothetical protein Y1Q_0021489 [Alligator mississippiensis]|uniref:Uncharacterized protein n=1 Tax=Alligator mississippiensis TaxID=8496 RepID=A0A151PA31_ALLMI|nr:hypothetical protein Y1Q_0021489 [Alligator mississippiensis]
MSISHFMESFQKLQSTKSCCLATGSWAETTVSLPDPTDRFLLFLCARTISVCGGDATSPHGDVGSKLSSPSAGAIWKC